MNHGIALIICFSVSRITLKFLDFRYHVRIIVAYASVEEIAMEFYTLFGYLT